jgi:putative intracellular protease/amidase
MFIATLRSLGENAEFILTVCTGSILLARTGMLNGRRATSNKRLFAWTKTAPGRLGTRGPLDKRRGNLYQFGGQCRTDLALGFVADLLGYAAAHQVSREI